MRPGGQGWNPAERRRGMPAGRNVVLKRPCVAGYLRRPCVAYCCPPAPGGDPELFKQTCILSESSEWWAITPRIGMWNGRSVRSDNVCR